MDELFPEHAQEAPHTLAPTPVGAPVVPFNLNQMSGQITGIATRIKLAEERYGNLQKRNQLTEETLLELEREMTAEARAALQQVAQLRRQVNEITQKVDAIQGEMSGFVKRHDFAVVERYLDLWQPVRFLTRDAAQRMIEDAVRDAKSKTPAVKPNA